ncbi:hypothetical protein JJB98_29025 [Bradyrhizobium diazoefficiens]|nr:hypothetical protein [Bradyrhizobium diazoefficiens]QQO23672.1 hypothetical protein JJB98_29025 [Bradyrhizobium diazoefficiens]
MIDLTRQPRPRKIDGVGRTNRCAGEVLANGINHHIATYAQNARHTSDILASFSAPTGLNNNSSQQRTGFALNCAKPCGECWSDLHFIQPIRRR